MQQSKSSARPLPEPGARGVGEPPASGSMALRMDSEIRSRQMDERDRKQERNLSEPLAARFADGASDSRGRERFWGSVRCMEANDYFSRAAIKPT